MEQRAGKLEGKPLPTRLQRGILGQNLFPRKRSVPRTVNQTLIALTLTLRFYHIFTGSGVDRTRWRHRRHIGWREDIFV